MAIEDIIIEELHESGEGEAGANEDTERVYGLEGSDDDAEVKTALLAHAPATINDIDGNPMQREGARVRPVHHVSGLWIGTVRYAKNATTTNNFPPVGTAGYSFDTSGGTQHITHSRATMGSYKSGSVTGSPPSFSGAIGVESDGVTATVNGCDIDVPVYNWEETHILSGEQVTASYRVTAAILTGAVNNNGFRGFAAGEVLFRGARGSRRSDGRWEVSFSFSALPNVSGGQLLGEDFKVGDITITTKKGWDYVWVYYTEQSFSITLDGDAKTIKGMVPTFAYVERVRPYGNLNELELPDPE